MKTAISLPDELFAQTERWVSALGVSRSAFFARAAEHYIEQLSNESLTEQINASLAITGNDDESFDFAIQAGRRLLAADGDDW
jgi:metal-responsive CopG/Arc/MetJ family transcriptional regulator